MSSRSPVFCPCPGLQQAQGTCSCSVTVCRPCATALSATKLANSCAFHQKWVLETCFSPSLPGGGAADGSWPLHSAVRSMHTSISSTVLNHAVSDVLLVVPTRRRSPWHVIFTIINFSTKLGLTLVLACVIVQFLGFGSAICPPDTCCVCIHLFTQDNVWEHRIYLCLHYDRVVSS